MYQVSVYDITPNLLRWEIQCGGAFAPLRHRPDSLLPYEALAEAGSGPRRF